VRGTAVHKLFICSKRNCFKEEFVCFLFEHMNNLQTVIRLVVDKFTSQLIPLSNCMGACELANNLRLKDEEEYYLPLLFKEKNVPKKGHFNFAGKRDILTLR
jgi:hypothetical protein